MKKIEKVKYFWKIGCKIPIIEQHSKVKHMVIGEYIKKYILTVMSNAAIPAIQLSLIDAFSGGGCYQDEEGVIVDGSPVIIMKSVAEARALLNINRRSPRIINVDYYFNDISEDTKKHLEWHLNCLKDDGKIKIEESEHVKFSSRRFSEITRDIVDRIKDKKMGERAIFVLDQYAYKDVPITDIAYLLKSLRGCEIILTFNVGSLITYLSECEANKSAMKNIGLDKYIPWAEVKQLKIDEKHRWKEIIQRYLANGIKLETGSRYMTLFFVSPDLSSPWEYWLVHLTNQYRAHEVMKQIHWAHSTEFTHELDPGVFVLGYDTKQDVMYNGQEAFDFSEKSKRSCIENIHISFGRHVFDGDKPVRIGDIYGDFIGNTPAAEYHLNAAVRSLHSYKDVVIRSSDGRVKRPSRKYHHNDIIEPSRQYSLFRFTKKSDQ